MSAREAIEGLQAAYVRVRDCGEPQLNRRERAISAVESTIASAVSELAELDRQLVQAREALDLQTAALAQALRERDEFHKLANDLARAERERTAERDEAQGELACSENALSQAEARVRELEAQFP